MLNRLRIRQPHDAILALRYSPSYSPNSLIRINGARFERRASISECPCLLTSIPSHGRDNALRIWQLGITDEHHLSKVLPAEAQGTHHPKPWLLHTLPVNTLNFCAFTMCHEPPQLVSGHYHTPGNQAGPSGSILVAVPARDDAKIEVYRFPDEKLLHIVPKVTVNDTGKAPAVASTSSSCPTSLLHRFARAMMSN